MASLQAYQSHGHRYYRIVESFRQEGKPRLRVVAHLGRVEDILRLTQDQRSEIKVSSVTAGAVTALHHLAQELDVVGKINRALALLSQIRGHFAHAAGAGLERERVNTLDERSLGNQRSKSNVSTALRCSALRSGASITVGRRPRPCVRTRTSVA